jgi:hypothetical protein
MDKITTPLPVPFELGKATPDILHAILDPPVGNLVKSLMHPVKTTWVEEVDEGGAGFPSRPSLPRGHAGRQVYEGTSQGGGSNDPKPTPP